MFDGGPLHGTRQIVPQLLPFLTFRETWEDTANNGVVYHREKSPERYLYELDGRYYRFKGVIKGVDIVNAANERIEKNAEKAEKRHT